MLRHRGCRAGAGLVPQDCGGCSGSGLERPARQGESPVRETLSRLWLRYLSTAGHEKPRRNLGGPPSKATYSSVTDSAPVP